MLASRVRGRSQQESAIKGVERGSLVRRQLGFSHPVWDVQDRECKFRKAIRNPCDRQVCQSRSLGVIKAVKASIARGIRVFSIVRGLVFGGGQSRACERRLPEGLARHLLRKLKKLALLMGQMRGL